MRIVGSKSLKSVISDNLRKPDDEMKIRIIGVETNLLGKLLPSIFRKKVYQVEITNREEKYDE